MLTEVRIHCDGEVQQQEQKAESLRHSMKQGEEMKQAEAILTKPSDKRPLQGCTLNLPKQHCQLGTKGACGDTSLKPPAACHGSCCWMNSNQPAIRGLSSLGVLGLLVCCRSSL